MTLRLLLQGHYGVLVEVVNENDNRPTFRQETLEQLSVSEVKSTLIVSKKPAASGLMNMCIHAVDTYMFQFFETPLKFCSKAFSWSSGIIGRGGQLQSPLVFGALPAALRIPSGFAGQTRGRTMTTLVLRLQLTAVDSVVFTVRAVDADGDTMTYTLDSSSVRTPHLDPPLPPRPPNPS